MGRMQHANALQPPSTLTLFIQHKNDNQITTGAVHAAPNRFISIHFYIELFQLCALLAFCFLVFQCDNAGAKRIIWFLPRNEGGCGMSVRYCIHHNRRPPSNERPEKIINGQHTHTPSQEAEKTEKQRVTLRR
jgi:hypothetical protein